MAAWDTDATAPDAAGPARSARSALLARHAPLPPPRHGDGLLLRCWSPGAGPPPRPCWPARGPAPATSGPGQGIARADHFRAGSITKTFIATVVLQLAAEHRLSLSDTVEQHLPGLVRGAGNDGRALTLRALLTHTSGLVRLHRGTPGAPSPSPRFRPCASHSPTPRPTRGRFSYSNTNYVLLGLVVEQVTGRSYAAEAERRVIAPLGLTGTSFPGSRTSLPSPHGRAYAADGTDVTDLDPRVAGAAGELVTTLADLDRFYAALLGGRLLPPHWLREMLDTRTAHGSYGMGLFPVKLPCGTDGVGAQRPHHRQLRAHRGHRRRPSRPHLPA